MLISKRLPLIRDIAVVIGKMLFWTAVENCWEWEENDDDDDDDDDDDINVTNSRVGRKKQKQ